MNFNFTFDMKLIGGVEPFQNNEIWPYNTGRNGQSGPLRVNIVNAAVPLCHHEFGLEFYSIRT